MTLDDVDKGNLYYAKILKSTRVQPFDHFEEGVVGDDE